MAEVSQSPCALAIASGIDSGSVFSLHSTPPFLGLSAKLRNSARADVFAGGSSLKRR